MYSSVISSPEITVDIIGEFELISAKFSLFNGKL